MTLKDTIQSWLIRALQDPITQILLKNSHLTKTQLETLLIDVLSENLAGQTLKYDDKARLRLTKARISRGAFNRTLVQAKNNVVRAIYTILLLGYVGVFETTALDPYLEIANKLNTYMEALRSTQHQGLHPNEHLKAIKMIREQLETTLDHLSNP